MATMCRVLGVSTSGYYAWRQRGLSKRAQMDAALRPQIEAIHARSDGTYGAPRIHDELTEAGIAVGRKRIARLLRQAGLQGVTRRKETWTTRRVEDAPKASDLVDRDFTASGPNQLWLADITYVPTWAGFLYLAVVLDVWSRRIVGWAMASHLRTELVLDALDMSLIQRHPESVIHHSDHRLAIHRPQLCSALPQGRCPSLHGFGGRLLRQCHVREFLRHPQVRADPSALFPEPRRSPEGHLRIY